MFDADELNSKLTFAVIFVKIHLFFFRGNVPLNGKRGKRHGKIS